MGIPLDSPAHVIRALIDEGEQAPEALQPVLPRDYEQLRQRIQAAWGAGRKARVDMYLYGLRKLKRWIHIAHQVNAANVLHEPPFPLEDLPPYGSDPNEVSYPYVFDSAVWRMNYGHLNYDLAADEVKRPRRPLNGNGGNTRKDVAQQQPQTEENPIQTDTEHKRKPLTIRTAGEALMPLPPPDWLVEGLLASGSLSIVFGDAGTKKSYMMLGLAASVTLGQPWLRFKTQKGAALVVDEESTEDGLMRRLSGVLRGLGSSTSNPLLQYTWLENIDLRKPDDVAALHNAILITQARVVVIDALMDVLPGADENHVRDVLPALRALRKLAAETQSAIVVIHHANKQGGFRGSSSLKGAVDLMLKVSSEADSPYVDFESLKARDLAVQKFGAKITFNGTEAEPVVRIVDAQPGKGSKPPISSAGKYVLEYLKANGASGRKALQAQTDEHSVSTLKKTLSHLMQSNLIERLNEGGKGIEAVYGITQGGKKYV